MRADTMVKARTVLLILALNVTSITATIAHSIPLVPGDIVVTLREPGRVVAVNPATGQQTLISMDGQGLGEPNGLAIDSNGDLLVVDRVGRRVIRLDPTTSLLTTVSQAGLLTSPTGIALDPSGTIFIADQHDKLVRIDPFTGDQTLISTGGFFGVPGGIVFGDAGGTIFIGDPDTGVLPGRVLRVNPATGDQLVVSEGGLLSDPWGIALEADGDILVANYGSLLGDKAVFRINPLTGDQSVVSSGGLFTAGVGTGGPIAIAVEADGSLLVSDFGVDVLFRVNPLSGAQSVLSVFEHNLFTGLAIVPIPEPSTGSLLAMGLISLLAIKRALCSHPRRMSTLEIAARVALNRPDTKGLTALLDVGPERQ